MTKLVGDVSVRRGLAFAKRVTGVGALVLFVLTLASSVVWARTVPVLKIGDILVVDALTDNGRGAILLVDPITGAQSVISSRGFFQNPVSLAINRDGTIVVSDRLARAIFKVDPTTGGQTVIQSTGFIDPFGLALDANGDIYVADSGWDQMTGVNTPGRLLRVNPTTGAVTVVASGGYLSDPWTVAVESTGNIVLTDSTSSVAPFTGQGGIIRVNPVTGVQTPVSVFQLGPPGTPGCPFGITIDNSGNILTTTFSYPDPPQPLVYGCVPPAIFRTDALTGATTTVSSYPTWGWRVPFGIDVANDGTIWVVDESIQGLFRVDPATGTPTPISLYGLFVNPVDVAVVKFAPVGGGGNSAPLISTMTVTPGSLNEGATATMNATFSDPDAGDTHIVYVNWGDGTMVPVDVAAGVGTVSATHQYLDDNGADSYTVSVMVTDAVLSDTKTTTVAVHNLAPVITGTSGPAGTQSLGSVINISASFTDAGVLDTHTCSAVWGDTSSSAGAVTELNGSGSCTLTHTYTAAGTYNVNVTVTDDDGNAVSSTISLTVNAATSITSLVATGPVNENSSTTLTGAFTDGDAADTHSVTITWGDGSTNTVLTLAAGVRNFSTTHQYLDDNPTGTASDIIPISVVIADNHGSSNSGNTSVTVKNVAPAISSVTGGPTAPVILGTSITLVANFTDAGTKDTHVCKFTWGDTQTTSITAAGTGNGSCTASHTYAAAGAFVATVTVTDDDTGAVTSINVPVTIQNLTLPSKIVFMSTRDGNAEIYSMNSDGTGVIRLTNNSATDAFPVWSPDRTKILFTSTRSGGADIYVMNANGSGLVRLTTSAKVDGGGSWSPDGSKIAFTTNRDGNYEIYVMNANGSAQTRLTNHSASDISPVFSPNGTKIAFATNRDGQNNFEIYVMNTNGSGLTRLTNNAAVDLDPAWSPDGTKIAFSTNRDGQYNSEIYVMTATGTGVTRLTNNAAIDAEPTWSADGTKILFTSNRISQVNAEIYSMKADGTLVVRLTNNSALDTSGNW